MLDELKTWHGTETMQDEIKAVWLIAGALIVVLGLLSFFA